MTDETNKNAQRKIRLLVIVAVVGLIAVVMLMGGFLNGGGQPVKSDVKNEALQAITDHAVAKLGDIPPGTIKQFTYNGEPAILVNFGGELAAYVNSCPHKGAQFNSSSLVNDRILCPLHGATFKPTTGDYLGHADGNNYGLKGLTRINIKIVDSNIYAE